MQHGIAKSPMRLRRDLLLRMSSSHFQFQKRIKVIRMTQNRPQTPHFKLSIRFPTPKLHKFQIPRRSNLSANTQFLKWRSSNSIDNDKINKIAKKTEWLKPNPEMTDNLMKDDGFQIFKEEKSMESAYIAVQIVCWDAVIKENNVKYVGF